RVVVVQVRVRVLEAAVAAVEREDRLLPRHGGAREAARPLGEECADEPVEPGAEDELPEPVAEAALVRGVEADLLDRGRVALDEVVARDAQLAHEAELEVLQVLDAAPRQVRRLLAGEPGEVPAVDQRDARAAGRERSGRDRSVDATAEDDHVEAAAVELVEVRV